MSGPPGSTERPRLLFVTPVVPAFTGLGAAMRCAHSLSALCDSADVTLVLVRRTANRSESIDENLRGRLSNIVELTVPDDSPTPRARVARMSGIAGLVRRALHPEPLELGDYPPVLADRLSVLAGLPWHSMHVFRLRVAPLAVRLAGRLGIPRSRRVLDLDDVESLAMRRLADARRKEIGRATYWLEYLESVKTARAEERLAREFATVLLCSTKDRDEFQRRCPGCDVNVLPNVYPLPENPSQSPQPSPSTPTVLFVGSLDYPPNQDAVHLLLRQIVPRVRARAPAVVFRVAGRRPPEWMRQDCAATGVELIADPPDMGPLYRAASLAIAPLLSGGGTRIKILEAFAYEVPMVATTVGAEGLMITHGRDVLISDTAEGLAQHVVALLADAAFRQRLITAGRHTLQSNYGASVVRDRMGAIHNLSGIGVA
jgi:glycosyltransferase involved in cell wall biosynthesis